MFKLRESLATDDELRRQNLIVRVVFGHEDARTLFDKKALAIAQGSNADALQTAKVRKRLPEILEFVRDDGDLLEVGVRTRIANLIKNTKLTDDDHVWLPIKLPVYVSPTALSNAVTEPQRVVANIHLSRISRVSLADFEAFAFNSRILYKYYKNTSFASYLFQNLVYSQKLIESTQLNTLYADESQPWQVRLASLLFITNVREQVANDAFYADEVIYENVAYDTSYVPNYDVQAIQPLGKIVPFASEQDMINYYYSFDPSTTKEVPSSYMSIFMSFPFKNGYHVRPDGSIIFANLPRITRYSITNEFTRICGISDIEAAIENVARRVTLTDALSYAAYAKTLTAQGIALMVARRIARSDTILLPTISAQLRLSGEFTMLSWMTFSCKLGQITMPVLYRTPTGDKHIALVRDIARSCASKLGAAILCSPFCIPELDINYVHANLVDDAETYVLYTLVLQQYANMSYYAARNSLRPKFGNTPVDLSIYEMSGRPPAPLLEHTDYRVAMFGDYAVAPNDCSSERCLDNYEFTDPQLNALAISDQVELTPHQLSAYISSTLTR